MRFVAVCLLAGTALAGPPKAPVCVPDSDTAVKMARTRGKLIFLTVLVDNDGENRAVVDNVFRDRAFLKISKEFICVYANPHDDHGKVSIRNKQGKKELRCADAPSITCLNHMFLAQNYARAFFPGNEARCPIHFVIDGDEEVVATIMNGSFEDGFNHVPSDTVVSRLKKLLKKHGRGLTEDEYKKMETLLVDAKAARARKKTTLELEKLSQVVAVQKEVDGVKLAKARIQEIDKKAARELKGIEDVQIAEKKWEEALDALEKIRTTYPGTLTAQAAKKRNKELQDTREVKRLLKARDLYERGLAFKKRKKVDLAKKKFAQCVKRYPETKYAKLCEAELSSMSGG